MSEPSSVPRYPWPVIGASLAAFTALAIALDAWAVMATFSAALLAHRLVDARLPNRPWAAWVPRIALYGALVAWMMAGSGMDRDARMFGSPLETIGVLSAVEIVIQSWRLMPSGGPGGLVALLLSGFVLLAGVNVDNTRVWPVFVVPAYFGLLIPAFRSQRARSGSGGRLRLLASGTGALGLGLLIASALRFWNDPIARMDIVIGDWLRSTRVGEGGNPRLGDGPGEADSMERVLIVSGPLADPHLRGTAYDEYRHGTWGPEFSGRAVTAAEGMLRPDAAGVRIGIRRVGGPGVTVYVPLNAAGIATGPGGGLRWDSERGGSLAGGKELTQWVAIQSEAADFQGPLCAGPSPGELPRLLEVPPEIEPGVRDLAETIGRSANGPSERVAAVVSYLQKNHAYSLSARPGSGDPVSRFLLGKLEAHCEYFASAAVILLRVQGVPARYVSGFYAYEGSGSGTTTVRQRDAHAWAEAWIAGKGWVTVEATPSDGRPDLAKSRPSWFRRSWERIRDVAADAIAWIRALGWSSLGFAAGAGAGAAGLWLLFRRFKARRRRQSDIRQVFRYSPADPRLAALAARFERELARRNIPCPPDRTWSDLLATRTELKDARHFAQSYAAARFGSAGDAGELEAVLSAIENEAIVRTREQ